MTAGTAIAPGSEKKMWRSLLWAFGRVNPPAVSGKAR
jgi:hypothetical protein